MLEKRNRAASRRNVKTRIRSKVLGTAERPRLCVFRSLKHTYAQLVNDLEGKVLLTVTTVKLGGKKLEHGGNVAAARSVGKKIAEEARKKGFEKVVFDRSGYIYHGRVKALAEAAREGGLKF